MRRFEANPYYSPEKCGLEQMYSLHGEEDYSFDMAVIWRDSDSGKYYFAQDSGCSCPSPFEDFHSLDDLTELNADTLYSLKETAENLYNVDKAEARSFISSAKHLIND